MPQREAIPVNCSILLTSICVHSVPETSWHRNHTDWCWVIPNAHLCLYLWAPIIWPHSRIMAYWNTTGMQDCSSIYTYKVCSCERMCWGGLLAQYNTTCINYTHTIIVQEFPICYSSEPKWMHPNTYYTGSTEWGFPCPTGELNAFLVHSVN